MWRLSCFKETVLSSLLMVLILQLLIIRVDSACSCVTSVTVGYYDSGIGDYVLMPNCLTCSVCPRNFVMDIYDDWNGYGLTSVYNCQDCSINCISCTSPTVCTACASGYTLDTNNMCVPCTIAYGSSCSACDSLKCTNCLIPFVLNNTATGNLNIYQ